MKRVISIAEVKDLVGTEVGVSDWMSVPQSRIDLFADATDDHQFIHVDPERAKDTPFGGTIAHGFLTVSMLSAMHSEAVPGLREDNVGINYGFNKIRFMAPVPAGGRIRGRFFLKEARMRGPGMLMTTFDVTVEIDGGKKPALTASWMTIIQFDPKDVPGA
ncbi:MaoC family dehydratase [Hoeflea ulvae]|uniref:MaoC family dehydratase n=1 Tax=Hoeflea ulvae TaxID=2983764 RepID=A0ABT3YL43_9HYPH|nr:MaoC family dehydratase [Hoeflea ulvae]MCY0096598.1 MaoC family dehydratase [Hoeflea ulvae]